MSTGYVCKVCNRGVVVTPEGKIVRGCGHEGAGVLATMEAHATGQGAVSG